MKKPLPIGSYKVTIKKTGFEDLEKTIAITPETTTVLNKKLISNASTLKITTTQGATIKVDGKPAGIGSVEKQLLPGVYYVAVEKKGYFPIKNKMITLHKGKTTTLDLPLKKREGILILMTKPTGANVYVDGIKIGKTPLSKKIMEGNRTIKVEKEGYETIVKNYDIEYNKKITKNIVFDSTPNAERCNEKGNEYYNNNNYSEGSILVQKSSRTRICKRAN